MSDNGIAAQDHVTVRWAIDAFDVKTPLEAAVQAAAAIVGPGSIATVFEVDWAGTTYRVDLLDKTTTVLAKATQPGSASSDSRVVDDIAALLGYSTEWDSEYLEHIADMIGGVRPHPGQADENEYAAKFRAATGRELP